MSVWCTVWSLCRPRLRWILSNPRFHLFTPALNSLRRRSLFGFFILLAVGSIFEYEKYWYPETSVLIQQRAHQPTASHAAHSRVSWVKTAGISRTSKAARSWNEYACLEFRKLLIRLLLDFVDYGSSIPPFGGLHLLIRFIASRQPLMQLCFWMAKIAYSEQVGSNLHESRIQDGAISR